MFENLRFGVVKEGLCRLSVDGKIAIKTESGYKTFSASDKKLVNCFNFTVSSFDKMFYTIPSRKIKVGDIIIYNDTPKCVISVGSDEIEALDYKTNVAEKIIPERHILFGGKRFFTKIISLFNFDGKDDKKSSKLMKLMMLSQMNNNADGGKPQGLDKLMPLLFLSKNSFGGKDSSKLMKLMMLSQMSGNANGDNSQGLDNLMPLLLLLSDDDDSDLDLFDDLNLDLDSSEETENKKVKEKIKKSKTDNDEE